MVRGHSVNACVRDVVVRVLDSDVHAYMDSALKRTVCSFSHFTPVVCLVAAPP